MISKLEKPVHTQKAAHRVYTLIGIREASRWDVDPSDGEINAHVIFHKIIYSDDSLFIKLESGT